MRFSGANWRHYQQFCEFAAFRFFDRNFNRRFFACFFLIKTFHENPTQWTLATAWTGRPDPPCRSLNGTHVRNILLALFDFSLKRTRCVYASRIRHEVHSDEANFCDCHFLRSNSYVNSVTIFECYHLTTWTFQAQFSHFCGISHLMNGQILPFRLCAVLDVTSWFRQTYLVPFPRDMTSWISGYKLGIPWRCFNRRGLTVLDRIV